MKSTLTFIGYFLACTLILCSCKNKEQEPIPTIDDANLDTKVEYREEDNILEDQIEKPLESGSALGDDQDISYHDEFKGKSMVGHFIYMADAAVFTPCGQKKAIPVLMGTKVYMDLEEAYLNTVEGGTACFVELLGKIEKRPSYDGGKKVDMLVVDKVIEVQFYRDCP
ncbi:MAG TPA: hypothetical protein PKD85_21995 [Saprospiraceae bacterium]|nr:hypothetical protein [Saprospiraceae bacterium]